MKKAILATKVGMTQIFNEDGVLTPVTVLQAGPCVVTQIKTVDVSLGTTKEYEFTGVTLKSLMEIAGATECTSILVKSSDGWEVEVAAADALAYDILITDDYVGGKDIPADAGGPIKMVFPATEHPELNDTYDMYAWQWYVSEVEFK